MMKKFIIHICDDRIRSRDRECLNVWNHLKFYPNAFVKQSGPYIETEFFIHFFIPKRAILEYRLNGLEIVGVSICEGVTITEEENLYLLSRIR
jgi:hypothetical protein